MPHDNIFLAEVSRDSSHNISPSSYNKKIQTLTQHYVTGWLTRDEVRAAILVGFIEYTPIQHKNYILLQNQKVFLIQRRNQTTFHSQLHKHKQVDEESNTTILVGFPEYTIIQNNIKKR